MCVFFLPSCSLQADAVAGILIALHNCFPKEFFSEPLKKNL